MSSGELEPPRAFAPGLREAAPRTSGAGRLAAAHRGRAAQARLGCYRHPCGSAADTSHSPRALGRRAFVENCRRLYIITGPRLAAQGPSSEEYQGGLGRGRGGGPCWSTSPRDWTCSRASVRRHRRAQGGSPMRRSIRPKRARVGLQTLPNRSEKPPGRPTPAPAGSSGPRGGPARSARPRRPRPSRPGRVRPGSESRRPSGRCGHAEPGITARSGYS